MAPVEDDTAEPDARDDVRDSSGGRARPVRADDAIMSRQPFRGRRATIQDVAREAQVSVSTVSNVIRDAPGVRPQMKAKVAAAIEKLGYRPQAGARAMRGRSYTIGVMLTEFSAPFQTEIAEGIADELEPSPYQEIFVAGGLSPSASRKASKPSPTGRWTGSSSSRPRWPPLGWRNSGLGCPPW